MNKTIGVLGISEERSMKDVILQKEFNCARNNERIRHVDGGSIGVIGVNYDERSSADKKLQNEFSCSRENYCSGSGGNNMQMIEPRSSKDRMMLREFNPGACQEQFQYRSGHYNQKDKIASRNKESFYCKCQGNCGCGNNCNCGSNCPGGCGGAKESFPSGFATLNANPYNTSSNVKYVPLE